MKAACCSLEFRGLSGSQRGSSFAERVRALEMVFRGCRRNAVEEGEEKGIREQRGEGERGREKESTPLLSYFQIFPRHKLHGAHNFLFFSPPLLNDSAKLCNSSTTDKSGNRVMHPF